MDLYVFASSSRTNIWAGIGARMWAVSARAASGVGGIEAKAAGLSIGSLGALYLPKEGLTTPFLVTSEPEKGAMVRDVWPEPWTLAFGIRPLGTPRHIMNLGDMKKLQAYTQATKKRIDSVYRVTPTQAFSPASITQGDWATIIEQLSHY